MADLASPYVNAIKQFEGFAPSASWDYRQYTNGYGTRARFPGERISREEAEQRFNDELGGAGDLVASNFPDLPQGHHAALTSLTFNAGPGWMNSGLGDAVRAGDWDTARRLFQQYNKAGGAVLNGLSSRRAEEASWFDNEPGALSYTAEPRTRGNTMADPALSARFLTGSQGALGGGGDIGDALQRAAAWGLALDTGGKSLGALGPLVGEQKYLRDFQTQQQEIASTRAAYIAAGLHPRVADAAARNAVINQQAAQGAFGEVAPKIIGQTEDAYGNKQTSYGVPVPGQPGNFVPPRLNGAALDTTPTNAFLAKGVKELNPEITDPDEYLNQFSPEVKDWVKAQAEGRLPVTSNMRRGFLTMAQPAAIRYGELTGVPMDIANVKERQQLATGFSSAQPGQYGGQRLATQTGFNHLKDALDIVDALNNSNGVINSEYLARALNRPIGSRLNTTDREALLTELLSKGTAYAGERTKLLAGRAGGQEERKEISEQIFGGSKSDKALRAGIRSEMEIMLGKANPLQQTLDNSTLNPQQKTRFQVLGPEQQKIIDDIYRRTGSGYSPTAATSEQSKFDKYYK
jgi:GH24 family phage-related lysozyme (muramidase)